MAYTLEDMVDRIQQILQDDGTIFTDAVVKAQVVDDLPEFSKYLPYKVRETLATTDGSRTLDISTIYDLLGIDKIEYQVDKDPQQFRNYDMVDYDTIRIRLDYDCDGNNAYLYCRKSHHLDADWVASTAYSVGDYVSPTTKNGYRYRCTTAGTSDGTEPASWPTTAGGTVSDNTVTWTCVAEHSNSLGEGVVNLEQLFANFVAANCALNIAVKFANKVNVGSARAPEQYVSWGASHLAMTLSKMKSRATPRTMQQYPTQ